MTENDLRLIKYAKQNLFLRTENVYQTKYSFCSNNRASLKVLVYLVRMVLSLGTCINLLDPVKDQNKCVNSEPYVRISVSKLIRHVIISIIVHNLYLKILE